MEDSRWRTRPAQSQDCEENVSESKGMLMIAPMVRAILEGRKTQTRRIIRPQPGWDWWHITCRTYSPAKTHRRTGEEYPGKEVFGFASEDVGWVCPHPPSSLVYGKETFSPWADSATKNALRSKDEAVYRADFIDHVSPLNLGGWEKWTPSIFMPRHLSRITLRIESVRVERVQDITEKDAECEGVIDNSVEINSTENRPWRDGYKRLWESINGKGSWAKNPWVWAYTFSRVK